MLCNLILTNFTLQPTLSVSVVIFLEQQYTQCLIWTSFLEGLKLSWMKKLLGVYRTSLKKWFITQVTFTCLSLLDKVRKCVHTRVVLKLLRGKDCMGLWLLRLQFGIKFHDCFYTITLYFTFLSMGIVDISFQSTGTGKYVTPNRQLNFHFPPLAVSYECFPWWNQRLLDFF